MLKQVESKNSAYSFLLNDGDGSGYWFLPTAYRRILFGPMHSKFYFPGGSLCGSLPGLFFRAKAGFKVGPVEEKKQSFVYS